jgi:hypothetical protein
MEEGKKEKNRDIPWGKGVLRGDGEERRESRRGKREANRLSIDTPETRA